MNPWNIAVLVLQAAAKILQAVTKEGGNGK